MLRGWKQEYVAGAAGERESLDFEAREAGVFPRREDETLSFRFRCSLEIAQRTLYFTNKLFKRHEAQWRPCHLEGKALRDAASWIEQSRKFRDERLDSRENYLRELQTKEKENGRRKK